MTQFDPFKTPFKPIEPDTIPASKVYATAGAAVLAVVTLGAGGGVLSWIASNKIKCFLIAKVIL